MNTYDYYSCLREFLLSPVGQEFKKHLLDRAKDLLDKRNRILNVSKLSVLEEQKEDFIAYQNRLSELELVLEEMDIEFIDRNIKDGLKDKDSDFAAVFGPEE